ncbi:MAG: helix-turn-helix domain-containing protein [Spirochaetales bacterium]|nr:helix-turn-helix domain-containing protein [Spirochaetales bacterium]
MVVNIVNLMSELGFSEYESRTYVALLQENPVTAYEAAKKGGLPTAKIYQVLAKLMDKGVVLELVEGGKKRYVPMDPEEFIARQKVRMNTNLSALKREMEKTRVETNVSYIWNINEREEFLQQAETMIGRAEKSLLISLCEEEMDVLYPSLKRKQDQGISLATVLFGQANYDLSPLFNHPIADTLQSEKGGRNFSLVADSTQAMAATILDEDRVEGAWSGNRGFVTVTEDYIKHDIYIMKIVSRFDADLQSRFGENYHQMRDVYHDKEEEHGKE